MVNSKSTVVEISDSKTNNNKKNPHSTMRMHNPFHQFQYRLEYFAFGSTERNIIPKAVDMTTVPQALPTGTT